jgi:hypothetical protein
MNTSYLEQIHYAMHLIILPLLPLHTSRCAPVYSGNYCLYQKSNILADPLCHISSLHQTTYSSKLYDNFTNSVIIEIILGAHLRGHHKHQSFFKKVFVFVFNSQKHISNFSQSIHLNAINNIYPNNYRNSQ